MFDLKKSIMAGLVAVFLVAAPSAWAASFVNGNLSMDITVSDMDSVDLNGFDMTVAYDSALLDFSGYVLTDELGSIDAGEASDLSYADGQAFTPGTISLSMVSLLDDADLADQSDDFVLVTLYFWGDEDAISGVDISSLDISITNVGLSSVSFSLGVATQTAGVPVPTTMLLLGTGLAGLVGISRRRK